MHAVAIHQKSLQAIETSQRLDATFDRVVREVE
jgi:hypothetical protein